jgi:hypothetical protein
MLSIAFLHALISSLSWIRLWDPKVRRGVPISLLACSFFHEAVVQDACFDEIVSQEPGAHDPSIYLSSHFTYPSDEILILRTIKH